MEIRTKIYLSLILPLMNLYIYLSTMLTVYEYGSLRGSSSSFGMRGRLRDGYHDLDYMTSDLSFISKWIGALFIILTLATLIPSTLYFLRLRYQDPVDRYCGAVSAILSLCYLLMIFFASIMFLAVTYKLDYGNFRVDYGTYVLFIAFLYSIFLNFVYRDKINLFSKSSNFDSVLAK